MAESASSRPRPRGAYIVYRKIFRFSIIPPPPARGVPFPACGFTYGAGIRHAVSRADHGVWYRSDVPAAYAAMTSTGASAAGCTTGRADGAKYRASRARASGPTSGAVATDAAIAAS